MSAKSAKAIIVALVFGALVSGCSNTAGAIFSSEFQGLGGSSDDPTGAPVSLPLPSGSNVMSVTVNGSLCGNPQYQYSDEPCVSVTICTPGTSQCQTISNILLDTGSYGLRIFATQISVPLTAVKSGTGDLAECVQFGDGSSEWGQVMQAGVQLGGEAQVTVPIELISSGYSNPPAACTSSQSIPDTTPEEAGFNGILGVGLFAQDCGGDCVTDSSNGQYFSCSGNTCSGAVASLVDQVQNPVSLLPTDNNGVILQLPSISSGGVVSASGAVIFGIGTQSNNQPSGTSTYTADASQGTFNTVFDAYGATSMQSFIDSGSSALFFPSPSDGSLPDCGSTSSSLAGLFCPSAVVSLTATNQGLNGVSNPVSFQVGSAYDLLSSENMVFDDLGVDGGTPAYFDWGLPFFFGRSVVVGIEGSSSSIGAGPYWAY